MVRARSRTLPIYTQYGGTMNVFRGRRLQKGHGIGGVLRGLFRSAMPLIKKGVKSLGKVALETGVQVANDVMAGEKLKSSLKKRSKQAGRTLINRATNVIGQQGGGRKRKNKQTRKRKQSKKRLSRKNISAATTSRRAPDIFGS